MPGNIIQRSEYIDVQCTKHIGQGIEVAEAQGLHALY
jgi:hypothetical protein